MVVQFGFVNLLAVAIGESACLWTNGKEGQGLEHRIIRATGGGRGKGKPVGKGTGLISGLDKVSTWRDVVLSAGFIPEYSVRSNASTVQGNAFR